MPVSTRSPRNKARRKFINRTQGTPMDVYRRERQWERRKLQEEVSRTKRINRLRKAREKTAAGEVRKKRGIF